MKSRYGIGREGAFTETLAINAEAPPPNELARELIRRIAGASADPSTADGERILELLEQLLGPGFEQLVGERIGELERRLDHPELSPELLDALSVGEIRLVRRR